MHSVCYCKTRKLIYKIIQQKGISVMIVFKGLTDSSSHTDAQTYRGHLKPQQGVIVVNIWFVDLYCFGMNLIKLLPCFSLMCTFHRQD